MTIASSSLASLDPATRRETVECMPKVELHCHLDGSLHPETMLALARDVGVTLPYSDVDALRQYMHSETDTSLEQYLSHFDATIAVLQTEAALERVAYELVQDAHRDGVRYIEVRNAPELNTRQGLSLDAVMEATLHGLARGEQATGTVARFIVCSLRHWSPNVSLKLANVAVQYKDRGVVAFDLAGAEAGHPARDHAEAFRYAREHGLHVTCHAGEGDGPDSIVQAVQDCGAERIGHGVRAAEDPTVVELLRRKRVPLEMCPTSNVQTRAVLSYEAHPLRRYLHDGLVVTINTDNRLISGTTLTEEMLHAIEKLGCDRDDLVACTMNAARAAFLPAQERDALVQRLQRELQEWGA